MSVAQWVGYPKSWTAGRNRAVQYVVVHYTAGSEGPTSAEDGAAYDKRRTDGTSTHVFVDRNSILCEVPDTDRAHAARFHGNEIGLQMELCGTAQNRAQWLDAASYATLQNAAKWTAEKCKIHKLPARRLTVAQTRAAYYSSAGNRPFGIVGHIDVTNAYPEDSGDHTDPGPDFPWDVFLKMVTDELAGTPVAPVELNNMARLLIVTDAPAPKTNGIFVSDGATRRWIPNQGALDKMITAGLVPWPTATPKMTGADATPVYGPDVDDLKGPKGDPGPATLAPHTHPATVGDAVPEV